jgi:acetyltransferase-like isoleucine patch superfamily enzyme
MDLFNYGYYNENDLKQYGFKSIGKNVLIDKNCTIIGKENISIGDNVRIDGFTTITCINNGYLKIKGNNHIASYCLIAASGGITFERFSGIAHGVKLYSSSDDYSGKSLTNPTISKKYKNEVVKPIYLGEHCIIGSNSVVLPGVNISQGVAVGAMSLVTKNLDEWGIYFGTPVNRIKNRSKKLLELEKFYKEDYELDEYEKDCNNWRNK